MTKKNLNLPDRVWDEISVYRHANRISSEMEAMRRLVIAGLKAEAKRPLKSAKP